ncbi:hypothetical protein Gekk315_00078 [Aeromonas phage Gekk3-15]
MAARTFTITEAKARIEAKCKQAPLSKAAAYFQNDCHIRVRADHVVDFFQRGYITEVQKDKMMNGYIASLKAKFL